jgi:ADP-ribose pyrophosphatase
MTTDLDVHASDVAVQRYEALRTERPSAFGEGPVRLVQLSGQPGCGVVHVDPWTMLVVDPVVMPDGRPSCYARVMLTIDLDAVAVLPVMGDQIVLLRHWRHATQSWHLEIPRGYGEIGVAPIDLAAAELDEELRLSGRLRAVGHMHPDTGMQSLRVALFVAEVPVGSQPFHDEGLATVVVMSTDDFVDGVSDGSIDDPFAIVCWMRHRIQAERSERDRTK